MSLKFYTLFTMLFIIVLGNFIYFFITTESTALDFLGIHLPSYPIALWSVVPLFLFYLFNILMMMLSSVQNYFKLKNYEHDFEKLKDAFYFAFLQKEKQYLYKTERYRLLGDIVASSIMKPKKDAIIEDNPKLQAVFQTIQSIDQGKWIDLSRFNLAKNNPLMVKNAHNLLRSDVKSAENILNHSENYDDAMVKEAYGNYVSKASLSEMMKYKKFVSIRSLLTILSRVNAEDNPIQINVDELLILSRHVTREINQQGFLELAMAIRKVLIPEDRMRYFQVMLENGFEVNEALLYTYFDLEMVDRARELLENFGPEDFPKYRAFLALKDINYSCNIDVLIKK